MPRWSPEIIGEAKDWRGGRKSWHGMLAHVLAHINENGGGTYREIAHAMGVSPNKVKGPLHELFYYGELKIVGNKIDRDTENMCSIFSKRLS